RLRSTGGTGSLRDGAGARTRSRLARAVPLALRWDLFPCRRGLERPRRGLSDAGLTKLIIVRREPRGLARLATARMAGVFRTERLERARGALLRCGRWTHSRPE